MFGMSEIMMRKGLDDDLADGYLLMYRGVEEDIIKHGVDIILGPRVAQFLHEMRGINEKFI